MENFPTLPGNLPPEETEMKEQIGLAYFAGWNAALNALSSRLIEGDKRTNLCEITFNQYLESIEGDEKNGS